MRIFSTPTAELIACIRNHRNELDVIEDAYARKYKGDSFLELVYSSLEDQNADDAEMDQFFSVLMGSQCKIKEEFAVSALIFYIRRNDAQSVSKLPLTPSTFLAVLATKFVDSGPAVAYEWFKAKIEKHDYPKDLSDDMALQCCIALAEAAQKYHAGRRLAALRFQYWDKPGPFSPLLKEALIQYVHFAKLTGGLLETDKTLFARYFTRHPKDEWATGIIKAKWPDLLEQKDAEQP